MLPWSLAIYRVLGEQLMPVFRDLSGKNWELAQSVVDIFKAHEGKTKKELYEALEVLTITPAYKFVKGLIRIMERRTVFDSGESAPEFRRKVFKRYPEDPDIRARELNMNTQEMLRKMLADINPVLIKVMPLSASELIKEYNLALAQTMLFKATGLEIKFSDERVYSWLKRLGLIYTMHKSDELFVDGPASIFSHTTRYGTKFAKFLPAIVLKPPWHVKAALKLKDKDVVLELDHLRHGYYFPDKAKSMNDDLELELKRCKLELYEKPIKIGDEYCVPNYRAFCNGSEFYIEVFKFWSWRYIEERAEKARKANVPIVFMLQKAGNVLREQRMPNNVLVFREKIKDEHIMNALELIKALDYNLEASAQKKSTMVKIEDKEVPEEVLNALRNKLEKVESYEEAENIIAELDLPPIATLHALGYRVVWRGLEPYRIKKRKE